MSLLDDRSQSVTQDEASWSEFLRQTGASAGSDGGHGSGDEKELEPGGGHGGPPYQWAVGSDSGLSAKPPILLK